MLPDGRIEVGAATPLASNCACEWNARGKVGDQSAGCGDLDPGFVDPAIGAQTCPPVTTSAYFHTTHRGTGIGPDYPTAEAAALADCASKGAVECQDQCLESKRTGYIGPPTTKITCCVPNQEPCEDDACGLEVEPIDLP